MALFQHVQTLTIYGSLNNVFGNQYNIAGPSSNPTTNALTIPAITSAGSVADVPLRSMNKKPPQLTMMFTGRCGILQQMIQFLDASKAQRMQKIFVLYGLGGASKTSIMMKFVDEFSDRFSNVYYVDTSTLATLQARFESIARNASTGETQRNEWLLLLNNADDPNLDFHRFFPHCTHGNIIVTLHNKECHLYAPNSNCCVSNMKPDDVIELLLTYAMVEHTDKNRRLCANIARELSYLALAVAQAGAFISQSSGLSTYMEVYQKDHAELLRRHLARSTDDYEWTVYTTWEINLKQLSSTVSTFLQICAFLHHDGISKKIIRDAALGDDPDGSFADAIQFLQRFKTAEGEWCSLAFHDCLHELLSYYLVMMHNRQELWKEAEELGLKVLEANKRLFGDEHRHTLASKHNLASTYNGQGRLKEVETLLIEVLGTKRRMLGEENPSMLFSKSNLATSYANQGQLKKAETLAVQVLEARRRVLGDEHPETLYSQSTLATIYHDQGHLKEATVLLSQVVEASRRLLGNNHPDTQLFVHLLSDLPKTRAAVLKYALRLPIGYLRRHR